MYKKGTGNGKKGKDAGNRTLCLYGNVSQAIRYLKECALIHISKSFMEKVFKYEETELSVINVKMKYGLTCGNIGYFIPCKAIREHVDSEDKRKILELEPKSKGVCFGTPL